MKAAITCPNCGNKGILEYSVILLIVLSILIIPGIIYGVVIYKRYKCPKCGCMRQPIVAVKQAK